MGQNTFSQKEVDTLKLVARLHEGNISYSKNGKLRFNKNNILTQKEITVITLICEEHSSKKIGAKLKLSKGTIDKRRKNILRKLKLKNVVGIVKYAIKNKLYAIK
ncbi:MAG: response regulator transcription factor [Bacteroidetes bacterium]|nr:response regulator transcription factor [Bacteroidota bacterium]